MKKSTPIKDHMHLWKIMFHAARHRYPNFCFADWEDAASYSYECFTKVVSCGDDRWSVAFAYAVGRRRAIHYFSKELNQKRYKKLAGNECEENAKHDTGRGDKIKLVSKCLRDIGDLMDKRKSGWKRKTSYVETLDKLSDERIRSGTRPVFSSARRMGVSRNSVAFKLDSVKKNPDARNVWEQYKEEAYS